MTLTYDILKQINIFKEETLLNEMLERCSLHEFEKGDVIVREGQYVKTVPIVVAGMLRVFQRKEDREILLYYVEPSQTCMMSLSAGFYNNESPSQAVATGPTQVITIPVQYVTQWQTQYPSWNNFVIRTFRNRYDELLDVFQSVAFEHIDKRVFAYLQQRKEKQRDVLVDISHQQLANELGTTRVVISRILKQFETDNLVVLHRGGIEVL